MNNLVKCICARCGKEFGKSVSEWKRSEKKAKRHFCSPSCAGNSNKDEYSPFRYFERKCRARNKKKGRVVKAPSLEQLKQLWDFQGGICPVTGWEMYLPISSGAYEREKISPNWASLDRIDNDKPYQSGNLRFVSYMANICRNIFSDEQLVEFAQAVEKNSRQVHKW